MADYRAGSYNVRRVIKDAKKQYKDGVESKLQLGDSRCYGTENYLGLQGQNTNSLACYLADDTVVVGLISNYDEKAYLDEVENLYAYRQDNHLSFNAMKTKEMMVDYRRQDKPYTPLHSHTAPLRPAERQCRTYHKALSPLSRGHTVLVRC